MSPTPRAAIALAVVALAALVLPLGLVAVAGVVLIAAVAFDAWTIRTRPAVRRSVPQIISRGTPVRMGIAAAVPAAHAVTFRQGTPSGIALAPNEGVGELDAELTARVRGRHVLPEVGCRAEGPLRLAAAYRRGGGTAELLVYPDLVTARRLALAAREGRLFDSRNRARGPLGLGTDFESVREWTPDDDVRHINWAATERTGRPMTNQYRLEQSRELQVLCDAGRLMAAPLGDRNRLDVALDAITAVGLTADELGDHCGVVAFDSEVRLQMRPRRAGGTDIVRALFDLQPRLRDSDYELAFRRVAGGRRALVLVLCDLFDDDAARALIEAVPVLARRHAVLIASVLDPDLEALVRTPPHDTRDVLTAAAAVDLLAARARAAQRLRHSGAQVVQALPERFPVACVQAYLTAKARLRL